LNFPFFRFLSAPFKADLEKISISPSGRRSIPIPSRETSNPVSSNSDEFK